MSNVFCSVSRMSANFAIIVILCLSVVCARLFMGAPYHSQTIGCHFSFGEETRLIYTNEPNGRIDRSCDRSRTADRGSPNRSRGSTRRTHRPA